MLFHSSKDRSFCFLRRLVFLIMVHIVIPDTSYSVIRLMDQILEVIAILHGSSEIVNIMFLLVQQRCPMDPKQDS